MAKVKTVEDIKAEAKKVMLDAKRKQKELLKEAADIEQKNVCELGNKCVEFLENKIDISTLKTFATNKKLVNIQDKVNEEKSDDVVKSESKYDSREV